MKHEYLQNFRTLDPRALETLVRGLGFKAAACYRLMGDNLVQILTTDVEPSGEKGWPVAAAVSLNYTASGGSFLPLGWCRPGEEIARRKDWPKGTSLYFPEQELFEEKVAIAVTSAPGKRLKAGELNASLEVLAGRLRHILGASTERAQMTEAGLREHIRTLGLDLHMLLDHEIRTPLASVSGYSLLLREIHATDQEGPFREYWQIIESQTQSALDALDKLSLALAADNVDGTADTGRFDAAEELATLTTQAKDKAHELVGSEAGERTVVKFLKATDQICTVAASRRLFRWAVWEVLKNAVIHARNGRVDVSVYVSNTMLVVDVADDGPGVSPGSEELVFLRFYQDPVTATSRKGKRGLGLGLFLARHIAERHLGQLSFVRHRGTSVFRFIWPLAGDAARPERIGA